MCGFLDHRADYAATSQTGRIVDVQIRQPARSTCVWGMSAVFGAEMLLQVKSYHIDVDNILRYV